MYVCMCLLSRRKRTDPKKGLSGCSNGAEEAALQGGKQGLWQHLAAVPLRVADPPDSAVSAGCDWLFPPSFSFLVFCTSNTCTTVVFLSLLCGIFSFYT